MVLCVCRCVCGVCVCMCPYLRVFGGQAEQILATSKSRVTPTVRDEMTEDGMDTELSRIIPEYI